MDRTNSRTIYMVIDDLPGFDRTAANSVGDFLESRGFIVKRFTADEYAVPYNRLIDVPPESFLTIIPKPDVLPCQCYDAIKAAVSRGSSVITLGGSLFYRVVERDESGQWALMPMEDTIQDASFAGKVPDDILPGLMPNYQVFPVYGCSDYLVEPEQAIVKAAFAPGVALDGICPLPYNNGAGYQRGRLTRYIPLVHFIGEGGRAGGRRGALAFLMAHCRNEGSGGAMLGSLGLTRQDIMDIDGAPQLLLDMVEAVNRGVFLLEGGTDKYAYMPGETGRIGAIVLNTSRIFRRATVRITVSDGDGVVLRREGEVTIAPNSRADIGFDFIDIAPREDYVIRTELYYGGELIDIITQEAAVLYSKAPDPDEFVTVRGDNFMLRGRPWYPVGVNFWPLYISGRPLSDGWLNPKFYAPLEIEYDLQQMQDIGINAAGIMIPGSVIEGGTDIYLDFLRRCGNHDIKVSAAYSAILSPTNFSEIGLQTYIERGRLDENTSIFFHENLWESGYYMFDEGHRLIWNPYWEKWIIERYGSIEKAERDWGMAVNRDADGNVASPPSNEFAEDGPWRIRMAAYRRFMDDFMSRIYNDTTVKIKRADPNHLVTHRQGMTCPVDYVLTAVPKHQDFIGPEGYVFEASEDGYNAIGFTNCFIDFISRRKPCVWLEFGQSVQGILFGFHHDHRDHDPMDWDRDRMLPKEEYLERQAYYHDIFYRATQATGSNGTFPWFWPGGYRLGEKSDFGIINADGTLRPSAELILKYAPVIKREHSHPEPQEYLTIDRDAHSGGYYQITFYEGKDAFAKASREGKILGVRTAGTGTTSKDTPLVAVGNVPYDGENPPKYLNGEFNSVHVKNADGQMECVSNGGKVRVAKGSPITLCVSAGNLGEATWIAGADTGCVVLSADIPGADIPLESDTPYLEDGCFNGELPAIKSDQYVTLRFHALNRMVFGEKFAVEFIAV